MIHMVLQAKGGSGKTVISTMLAQYLKEQGNDVICFDNDPGNATFSGFKKLNVQTLNIMDDDAINPEYFDDLMEALLTAPTDVFLIDNGASAFIPLTKYLRDMNAIDILTDAGHEVYIHTVVNGGQGVEDTLTGLERLAKDFSGKAKIIVWENQYFGEVVKNGKQLHEMDAIVKNIDSIASFITLEKQDQLFGNDITRMLRDKLTFAEINGIPEYRIMSKQRIKIFKDKLFAQIKENLPLDNKQPTSEGKGIKKTAGAEAA